MVAPTESLEWRRRFPSRALRRLGYLAFGGGGTAAGAWLLFGAEPSRLPSGERNPLSLVPVTIVSLVVISAMPLMLAVVRRPLVVADHYALTIRPGIGRTLLLPWAGIAEIAAITVREEPLLLVRLVARGRLGDRPGWHDQRVLHSGGEATTGYHLAVRMDEFVGEPVAQLATLAAWAPEQVRLTNRL